MNTDLRSQDTIRFALAIGFFALGIGVLLAYRTPATGYELSIYRSTPLGFWLGVALAIVVALFVAGSDRATKSLRGAALGLAVGGVVSIISIPLIRGYFFYGSGDSMTHLGWSRELASGVLSPFGIVYPGVHLTANYMSEVAGVGLTQTLQFIPLVIYPLLGALAIALCVNYLTESRWGLAVGAFVGLLFVPVNRVSVHFQTHPSSQAILFFAFVLYLLFRFVTQSTDGNALVSPISIALGIACVAMVFIHPQETMMLITALLTIAAVQLGARRMRMESRITDQPLVVGHAVLTAATFSIWIPQHARAMNRISYVVSSFLEQGSTTGTEVTSRASSLAAVGGTLEELFVKFFLVTLVIVAFAAILSLRTITGRLSDTPNQRNSIITYLTVISIPLGMAVVAVFFADQGDHYFRFFGLFMVPITILGGVAIAELLGSIERRSSSSSAVTVFAVVFVLMLSMQAITIHNSPYVYQSNKQVTEASMDGYSFAFEHRNEETPFLAFRTGPRRFVDAYYGRYTARAGLNFPGYRAGVPGEVFNSNMSTHYDQDRYFVLRDANYQTEVELYDGLRYSNEGIARLDSQRTIHRVQDNGGFKLYLVRNAE
ncbi:MAG: hypothetical protein ACQETB_04650 [Halobacteriota archaeon]